MIVSLGLQNYRNSGQMLEAYKSNRGTSCVEVLHSVMDKTMYIFNRIRQMVFDARAMWKITHYNRARLRAMGKPCIADGVSPSEDDSIQYEPAPDDFFFGFHYLSKVQEQIEEAALQQALREFEETAKGDVEDVEFEASNIDESQLGDGDDLDLADIYDDGEASLPPLENELVQSVPVDIPEAVSAEDIDRLRQELSNALNWAPRTPEQVELESQPSTTSTRVELRTRNPALLECSQTADRIAARSALSLPADTQRDSFTARRDVNSNRNVADRRAQAQSPDKTPPDFNPAMTQKWTEIWTKLQTPGDGISMRDWFDKASAEYNLWRMKELKRAEDMRVPPPPLFQVRYADATSWVDRMKKLSNAPQREGVVNEESRDVVAKLGRAIDNNAASDDEAVFGPEGLGGARPIATLSTRLSTVVVRPQAPTAQQIESIMQSNRSAVIERRNRDEVGESDLAKRQQLALGIMQAQVPPIRADPVSSQKRRCTTCYKYLDFTFIVDGASLPHCQLNRAAPGESVRQFCPIVDCPTLYYEWLDRKRQRVALKNRRAYEKSKESK